MVRLTAEPIPRLAPVINTTGEDVELASGMLILSLPDGPIPFPGQLLPRGEKPVLIGSF
jgi:hypothetical protein